MKKLLKLFLLTFVCVLLISSISMAYNITYYSDTEGNSVYDTSEGLTGSTTVGFPTNFPTSNGSEQFYYWATSPGGGGTKYFIGDSYTEGADVSLYPVFESHYIEIQTRQDYSSTIEALTLALENDTDIAIKGKNDSYVHITSSDSPYQYNYELAENSYSFYIIGLGVQALTADGNTGVNNITTNNVDYTTLTSFTYKNSNTINTIDVSHFPNLTALDCTNNANLTSLNISNTSLTNTALGISNYTGLQCLYAANCTNLTSLNISSVVSIFALDVSGCTNLTSLNASGCNLRANQLNLSGCTSLETVDFSNCVNSQFNTLNLSEFTSLTSLNVSGCTGLKTLDVRGSTNLGTLNCYGCTLTTIKYSNCPNISSIDLGTTTNVTTLWCENCGLSTLDLSNFPALTNLQCSNNNLTTLNVSSCASLATLSCSGNSNLTTINLGTISSITTFNANNNNLSSLDTSHLTNLQSMNCTGNTNLKYLDLSNSLNLSSYALNANYALLVLPNKTFDTASSNSNCKVIKVTAPEHGTVALHSVDIDNDKCYFEIAPENGYRKSSIILGNINIGVNSPTNNLYEVTLSFDYGGEELVATFVLDGYTVTFDANGGTGSMEPQHFNENEAKPLTQNDADIYRPGFMFDGWNTESNGTGESYVNGANFTATADTTLYAQWKIYVSFDPNGGTGATPIEIFNEGETKPLPNSEFEREGYIFDSWNTNANGLGDRYEAGDNFSPTANQILYAHWKLAITFDANGGTGTMEPETFDENETKALTQNTFTKSGYKFDSWNTLSNGNGTSYADGAEFTATEPITLYAQWKKKSSGGSGGGSSSSSSSSSTSTETNNSNENQNTNETPTNNEEVGQNETPVNNEEGQNENTENKEELLEEKPERLDKKNVIILVGSTSSYEEIALPVEKLLLIYGITGDVAYRGTGATLTMGSRKIEFTKDSLSVVEKSKESTLLRPAKIINNKLYITLSDFINLM